MANPIADPLVELPDTSPSSELVRIEATQAGAVTVVLDRPQQANAFDADLISALTEALETLRGAEGVRVVFLRGAGGTFSAGADAERLRAGLDNSEADHREDVLAMARMLKMVWDLPMLTVALVEGAAFGGGAGLAAACDIAIATRAASFSVSGVQLGLVPAVIAPYLVAAVGPRAARALFATGRTFDADEAQSLGLVTELVPNATALEAVRARIASESMACAPGAVAASKKLVGDIFAHPIDHGLVEETARRMASARMSAEGQEGVRAFVEGRKPEWTPGEA